MSVIMEIILRFGTVIFGTLLTIYVTMRYILREQKKAAEMPSKPAISFPHYSSKTSNIQCIVRLNDAYNITMEVEIGGNSTRKDLGSVYIRQDKEEGRSEVLDFSQLLENTNEDVKKKMKVTISYYSATGAKYTEKFVWKECEITKNGIKILPRTGSGNFWELSEAPWF